MRPRKSPGVGERSRECDSVTSREYNARHKIDQSKLRIGRREVRVFTLQSPWTFAIPSIYYGEPQEISPAPLSGSSEEFLSANKTRTYRHAIHLKSQVDFRGWRRTARPKSIDSHEFVYCPESGHFESVLVPAVTVHCTSVQP